MFDDEFLYNFSGQTILQAQSQNYETRQAAKFAANHLLNVIQRIMNTSASKVLLAVIVGWTISQAACSHSPSHGKGLPPTATARRILSADEAAQLAAQLANDQCDRQYRKRPFVAGQYSAMLQDSTYRWGGLDIGGRGGFSALVTFRRDGGEPHVEIYYSTDVLRPERIPLEPLQPR
jgi:hypothetical protein